MRLNYDTTLIHQKRISWYKACEKAAEILIERVPEHYRSRTFSGIIGDIKALSPKKALSLLSRKKGLGIQYARLYMTDGIDNGFGYQACASEAVSAHLADKQLLDGDILDVGCAVGVSGGVLGIESLTAFDLFPDIVYGACLIDSITGADNHYAVADMTRPWPFRTAFDTVIAGLVCHHLKEQISVHNFFTEAGSALKLNGTLLITLPSGSIAYARQLNELSAALSTYGFEVDNDQSGIIVSTDSDHSLFWMFLLKVKKVRNQGAEVFIRKDFGFHELKTPVTRVVKAEKARQTVTAKRRTRHTRFTFIDMDELFETAKADVLTFDTVKNLFN